MSKKINATNNDVIVEVTLMDEQIAEKARLEMYVTQEYYLALEENADNKNCIHVTLGEKVVANTDGAVKAANKDINEKALALLLKINNKREITSLEYFNKLVNSIRVDKYKMDTKNIESETALKDKTKISDKLQVELLKQLNFTLFSELLKKMSTNNLFMAGQNVIKDENSKPIVYSQNALHRELLEVLGSFADTSKIEKKHVRFLQATTCKHSKSKSTISSQYVLNYEVIHLANMLTSGKDISILDKFIETEK